MNTGIPHNGGSMGIAAFQFASFQYLKVQIFQLKSKLTIKKRHYL